MENNAADQKVNRSEYLIGDAWLVVAMTEADASDWNDSELSLVRLRALMAKRSDGSCYRPLGEMLDSRMVSRDDLTGQASKDKK